MVRVNLIPAYRLRVAHRRQRLRRWIVADVVFCAAVLMLAVLGSAMTDQRIGGLDTQLAQMETTVDGARRAITGLRSSLGEARLTLDASRAMTRQPDWSKLLALLSELRGADVVLTRCQLASAHDRASSAAATGAGSARRFEVEIHGFGREESAVSQFFLRLEEQKLFSTVKVVHMVRQPYLTGEAMMFELSCAIGDEPGGGP